VYEYKRGVLNKRAVIIVSSIAAIPLTALLIAAALFHRGRRKSLQTSRFLGQTESKVGVITTNDIHRQQQNEKSQRQLQGCPSKFLGKDRAFGLNGYRIMDLTNLGSQILPILSPQENRPKIWMVKPWKVIFGIYSF
jgi:hypothetical protein